MQEFAVVLVDIFIIFAAAKLAGEVFERLRQPAVIGELLVGMAIGPHALGLIGQPNSALIDLFGDAHAAEEALDLTYEVLAELGVIVLLFFVGLETRISDLLRVGRRAATVGVLGIVFPFAFGFLLFELLGNPTVESLFVATAMVATSVGITARVLRDLGVIDSMESRIILGAAVVDDILAMLLLAVVSGLGEGQGISALEVGVIAAQAVGFVIFVALVGTRLSRHYSLHLARLRMPDAPFVVAMTVMLGLAAVAGYLGLAAIIGAFMAGLIFAESREHFDLEHQTMPVYQFLVPFFFVVTGSHVDLGTLSDLGTVTLAAVVTVLAVAGKVIGAGLAAVGLPARSIAILGTGMVPRGEVGLIVASVGRSLGVIPADIFSVVVIMSIATTLVVPPLLTALYRGYRARPPYPTDLPLSTGATD